MVSIDVLAGIGAPPLNTTPDRLFDLHIISVQMWPHPLLGSRDSVLFSEFGCWMSLLKLYTQ